MILLALIVVVAAGAGVVVQLRRPLPPPQLNLDPLAEKSLAGAPPALPWPREGQAVVDVAGIGRLTRPGRMAPIPIGSLAKVMTAYLILRDHPLRGRDAGPPIHITAEQVHAYSQLADSSQSLLRITPGETLSERQALEAILVPSANNVADVLAEWDAGTPERFVARMNATAAELGLHDTHYADASGFNQATMSTAADQVQLAERAMTDPVFAAIVAEPSVRLPVAGVMRNYNSLLGTDGIVGVKTGSTRPAGGNLVFAARTADRFGQRFVVGAVLGQRVGEAAPVGLAAALSSAHALVRAAAVTPRRMTVLPAGTLVGTLHRADGGESIPVTISRPVELVGWPGLTPSLQTRSQQPAGLPTAGSQVGTLVAALGNQQAQAPLISAGSLAEPSWSSRVLRVR